MRYDDEAIQIYAQESAGHKILSREEEGQLADRIKVGKAAMACELACFSGLGKAIDEAVASALHPANLFIGPQSDDPHSLSICGLYIVVDKASKAGFEPSDAANAALLDAEEARNELVRHNVKLLLSNAHKYASSETQMSDLVQDGGEGLLKAAERFDPSMGFKFSTYASSWFKQRMTHSVMSSRAVRQPTYIFDNVSKMNKAIQALTTELGRAPMDHEIAVHIATHDDKVLAIKQLIRETTVVKMAELLGRNPSEDELNREVEARFASISSISSVSDDECDFVDSDFSEDDISLKIAEMNAPKVAAARRAIQSTVSIDQQISEECDSLHELLVDTRCGTPADFNVDDVIDRILADDIGYDAKATKLMCAELGISIRQFPMTHDELKALFGIDEDNIDDEWTEKFASIRARFAGEE